MKGVVKFAPGVGNVELRDVPEPVAGPGQVVIEVKAAGVCGTDIHIYHDEYSSRPPVVLGHELSGVVAERGPSATTFQLGDRVTSRTYFSTCGQCRYCLTGRPNLCNSRLSIGSGVNGAMAKYLLVPEGNLHRLPDNVSFLGGTLSEPLACNVHAVLMVNKPLPGEEVLVVGPGAIGLLALQLVKACGARATLLGMPADESRLALAKRLGADEIVLTTQVEELSESLAGSGFDAVLECSGSAGGVETALQLVRKGGRYTQVGLAGKKVSFDIDQIVYKEVQFSGTFAHVWQAWDPALRLMASGAVQTEPLVTHRFPLADWREAFATFQRHEGIKIVLEP
ncbi:MAG: zinc-binding dehydrogenase [Chloroflexi bacterium]|nr:zinc-binding dehydrogenase [Chloroflexota bacterium]MCL5109577.1 zinc-binding dehydrogenase [Chloroflexota bacterium]